MRQSRRRFLMQSMGALAAAQLLPLGRALPGVSQSLRKVLKAGYPLRVPASWNGSVAMVYQTNQQLWSDKRTKTFTVNGYPGATVRVQKGAKFRFGAHNMMQENLAFHWHGLMVPADQDGHPMDAFTPDQMKYYEFTVLNRAGTYFYHSHAHERTAYHVYNGMFGFFIVEDEEEQALNLPSGDRELLLAIQDVRIDANRQLVYNPNPLDRMEGYMGNTILVNGTPDAYLSVSQDYYRLRIVNASNARVYKLALDDDAPFHVIASDGGLLEAPVEVTSLMIGPAERYEILVDFGRYSLNTTVGLKSIAFPVPTGHMGSPQFPNGIAMSIMHFDVTEPSKASFTMPTSLSSIQRYDSAQAVRTRTFNLEMDMMDNMLHKINGRLFDMMRVDETVPFGDLEIWEFTNKDADMLHPVHVHGVQFQILSRSAGENLPAHERGWKDTVLVYPDETVRVMVKFDQYDGTYLLHCHNLEHEDDGMMMNFEVTGKPASVKDPAAKTMTLDVSPNPASSLAQFRFPKESRRRDLAIFDNAGRLVASQSIEPFAASFSLPLADMRNGVYWCRLDNVAVKLIVAH